MKIGYDAKRAFLNNTGLGNYSRWLIKLLATKYPDNTCFLYTPKIRPGKWPDLLRSVKNIKTVLPQSKLLTAWWRTRGLVKNIKADGVDVYHGLSHELPLGIATTGAKSVVTVHDVIFMRFPQYFGVISRAIYKLKLINACKTANRIIAVSQKTRQDLVELLHIDTGKIEVMYQGCDEAFKREYSAETKLSVSKKYNLPSNYLLSVGTIEERKNILLLIKALPLIQTDVKLVVVGRQTAYYKQVKQLIDASGLENRVVFLQNVPFADLPVIYQLASVFVYPSRYEGFGIPVLEALNCGVPVVAATGSCLEEAGGPDSSYVSPDDHQALAANINAILADDTLKANMIAQGLKFALNFDDDKLAQQLMHLYQTLHNA